LGEQSVGSSGRGVGASTRGLGASSRGLIKGPSGDQDAGNYRFAALYVRDALDGRLDHGHAAMWYRPSYIRKLFVLYISTFWSCIVFGCCILHVLLFFGA